MESQNTIEENSPQQEGESPLLLAPYDPSRRNVFITFGGSFFPPHTNHFRTYREGVLKLIGDPRFNLLASFMVPSHSRSLSKKLGASITITSSHREAICKLALQDYNSQLPSGTPPLQLQSFLLTCQKNQGFAKATSVIKEALVKHYKPKVQKKAFKIEQVSLIGADNVGLFEKKIQNGDLVVVVQNRPKQSGIDLQKWLQSPAIAPFSQNVLVVYDLQNLTELSSTQLRAQFQRGEDISQFVPSSVLEYHAKFKLKYPTETKPSTILQALNLQDLAPKSLQRIDISELQPELEDFQSFNPQEESKENFLEVGKLLGKGLQAKVRAYYWKKQKVALKIFSLKQSRSRKIRTFEREAQAYGLCMAAKAQNVVECFGVGKLGHDWLFLVLERGEEEHCFQFAKNLLNSTPLYQDFLRIMAKPLYELALGLFKMGEAKVLHRDLTTDNVLIVRKIKKEQKEKGAKIEENEEKEEEKKEPSIQSNFTLKVMDFGVCGHQGLIAKGFGARGSIRYYSPESAAEPTNYTPASDMFSFGLLVYELLHGTHIWPELKRVSEVLQKHDKGERPKIREDMPKELRQLIERTWAQHPQERIQFSEFAERISEIYVNL